MTAVPLLALVLSGCAVVNADAGPEATTFPDSSSSSAPPPAAFPAEIDCNSLLLPAAYVDFVSRGMSEIEFGTWNDNMQFMVDGDGIACKWGVPNSGEVAVFAALKMTAEQWEAKKADLIALGASESNTPIVGYVLEPEVDINVSRGGFTFRNGEVYYVSSDFLAQWIPPLTE